MNKQWKLGILGCGDFLRWMQPFITNSPNLSVQSLFDPNRARAEKYAALLGGNIVDHEDAIFTDPTIDIVCIFVPPFLRKALVKKAVAHGKHIITTKPLASRLDDAEEIRAMVADKVRFGVIYHRTGHGMLKTAREILLSGEFGKLALFRRDWIHHYPSWTNWALDPDKNGGPFMDAMIHNLNAARFLMAKPASKVCFFCDNLAHPDLRCTDTDMMKVDFFGGGAAYLFITWAADLAVYNTDGNNREHIDIFYLATDKGWRISEEKREGKGVLVASRDGKEKVFPIVDYAESPFERFVSAIETGAEIPVDFVGLDEACDDIRLLALGAASVGQTIKV